MAIKFLQRKSSGDVPFKKALIELIKSKGDKLIISTGYVFQFYEKDNINLIENTKIDNLIKYNLQDINDTIVNVLKINDLELVYI